MPPRPPPLGAALPSPRTAHLPPGLVSRLPPGPSLRQHHSLGHRVATTPLGHSRGAQSPSTPVSALRRAASRRRGRSGPAPIFRAGRRDGVPVTRARLTASKHAQAVSTAVRGCGRRSARTAFADVPLWDTTQDPSITPRGQRTTSCRRLFPRRMEHIRNMRIGVREFDRPLRRRGRPELLRCDVPGRPASGPSHQGLSSPPQRRVDGFLRWLRFCGPGRLTTPPTAGTRRRVARRDRSEARTHLFQRRHLPGEADGHR